MNASLGAAAYAALKQAVLDASLAPGSTASEPEIAARLGMSRTPVHEAVLRLQADGSRVDATAVTVDGLPWGAGGRERAASAR